jgi:hypothetical protein
VDCPESKFSVGFVIHNIFFDAFVESKTTKNIRYQLPLHVFLLWFQKLFSNSKYYFRSFCCFSPEWLSMDVFWFSMHFYITFLLCSEVCLYCHTFLKTQNAHIHFSLKEKIF